MHVERLAFLPSRLQMAGANLHFDCAWWFHISDELILKQFFKKNILIKDTLMLLFLTCLFCCKSGF